MYHPGQNSNPNLWDQRPQKIPRYPDPDRKKKEMNILELVDWGKDFQNRIPLA